MAVRRLVAALQRVAAADDAQLDAAIAAADLHGHETSQKQRQHAQQLEQHQFGAVLAAALARCLRAVSASPQASAARPRDDQQRRLLTFATNVAQVLHQWRKCCDRAAGARARLLQDVCSTELLDVLPAACTWLTAQLTPEGEPAQQPNRQQRRDDPAAVWHTADLAALLVAVSSGLAGLAAQVLQGDARNPAAVTAAAKVPAGDTIVILAPLAAALLRWYQRCHDSFAAAAAGATTQQQRKKVEADWAVLAAVLHPASVLGSMGTLLQHASEQGGVAAAVIAAAPELPWLAAVDVAGIAAAVHRACGGLSKSAMPLPGAAAGPSSTASSSSTGRRAGRAAGSSRSSSQGQGSPVPAFHSQLLAELSMSSLDTAFVFDKDDSASLEATITSAYCVLKAWVMGSNSSSSSSTQLSAASVRLLRSVLAELMVLDDGPLLLNLCTGLIAHASIAAARLQGRGSDTQAGDEEALELLLTMALPAAQCGAATAAGAGKSEDVSATQAAVETACRLINTLMPRFDGYSVFDSQLLLQHPAAVLGGLEAAVRLEVCDNSASGRWLRRQPFAFEVLRQADRSTGLSDWLQEAVSAQAAGSGSAAREAGANCSRLLCLLVACTKGVLAYVQQPSGATQLAGASGRVLLTFVMTSRLMDAAVKGAAGDGGSGGSTDAARQQQQHQQLHYGFGHLLGRSLAAAGSMVANVLPPSAAAGANSVPATPRPAAAAAAPAPGPQQPAALFEFILRVIEWLQRWLSVLNVAGYSQQQLLEPLEALEAAAAAVETLWGSPAARAEAAAAAASTGAAHALAVQLCLLRLNPAAGQQLSGSLVAMGGALCAALPTKHACNDPACTSCDKASEQQLVSSKGSVCSACRVARYCCVEHQRRHWRAHRPACKALVAAAAAASGGDGQASSSKKEKRSKAGGGGGSSRRRGG